MFDVIISLFLAGVSGTQPPARTPSYANDLCHLHNRFAARVDCALLISALQSGTVERRTLDHLIDSLRSGDPNEALKTVESLRPRLSSASASARAATEYVRGALLQIEHSSEAASSFATACSLAPEQKMYCFAHAGDLRDAGHAEASRSMFERLLGESEHPKGVTEVSPFFPARVLVNLSVLAQQEGDLSKSRALLTRALTIIQNARSTDEDARRRLLSGGRSWSGWLYLIGKQFSDSITAYEEALALDRKLLAKYPRSYRTDVARDLHNLANVHREMGHQQKAEKLLREALDIYASVARDDPGVGDIGWSGTVRDYTELYEERPDQMEEIYKQAITQMRPLAQRMPEAYEPDLASTLNDMFTFYGRERLYPEALEVGREEYTIAKGLWARNPVLYRQVVMRAAYDLADALFETGEQPVAFCPYLDEALSTADDRLKGAIIDKKTLLCK